MYAEKFTIRLSVVIEMIHWINKNLDRTIQAKDVTRQSGYTHWHFQRLFREVTGYTLSDYIRLSRILMVAHALATSPLKITHICFDHGFPSQQALARLFRQYCHCTPTEFRRSARENPDFLSSFTGALLKQHRHNPTATGKVERGHCFRTQHAVSAINREPGRCAC